MRWGYRAVLVVPLLHDDRVIGAMSVLRQHPGEFATREVELVTTFAGHSAIALEHARLFQEAQSQNRALQEALDYQTVTSEFLKSVSHATFELQPTLDTLAEHAAQLCGASSCLIFTLENGAYQLAAHYRAAAEFRRLLQDQPIRAGRDTMVGRTALERRPVHIPDVLADPEYGWTDAQRAVGYRSVLGVPLLREGSPIGVIAIHRTEVQPFAHKEIEVLTSFADQAVVAIEKIRLFHELRARTDELAQSVEELRALSQTTQTVNSSLNRERVLSAIAEHACRLCQADGGLITELAESTREFRPVATWNVRPEFVQKVLASPPTWGRGVTGQSAASRGAVQIPDVLAAEGYPWREAISAEGYRAILSVPLLRDDRVIGTIAVARKTAGAFAPRFVTLLTTFANQTSIALEHARLFQQVQEKAAQLEVVSRHKSQFLANMSHELRTPLNAIIGFSEVLLDPSLGALGDAERHEFLTNILTSGKHLLRLINDVLDLSKVEAGKMELHAEPVSLAESVEGVVATVKTLAMRKRIQIHSDIHPDQGPVCADPSRLKQILYNLLSNAIKFTPEEGRVSITARAVESPTDRVAHSAVPIDELTNRPFDSPGDVVEVSVTDTGVGIPATDLGRIFEEFEQVEHPSAARTGGHRPRLGPGEEGSSRCTGEGSASLPHPVRGARSPSRFHWHATERPAHRSAVRYAGPRVARCARRPATVGRWAVVEHEELIMSGKRILLVEDNAVNRRLAQFLLKSKGYEVWEATSAPEAFATLKERRPDLILMDIQLPEVDGLTATRRLKADPATCDIPVVAVTSYAMKGDEAKALEAGCSGYVTKPIDKAQLLDTVARLLPQPEASG